MISTRGFYRWWECVSMQHQGWELYDYYFWNGRLFCKFWKEENTTIKGFE